MRPTTADDNVFDFNALLHPGTVFEHPKDVVCHPGLTTAEVSATFVTTAGASRLTAECFKSSSSSAARHVARLAAQIAVGLVPFLLGQLAGGALSRDEKMAAVSRIMGLELAKNADQAAGIAEEALFRGYLLQQLAVRNPSPLIWMVLPALVFAALHIDPGAGAGDEGDRDAGHGRARDHMDRRGEPAHDITL